MCSKFEFETKYSLSRQRLYQDFENSLMVLGELVNSVVNIVGQSDKALTILYYVSKYLCTANQVQLCPFLMQEGCFVPWNHFLKTILELPVPQGEQAKSLHWKIKAIAGKLSYRLMVNYGMLTLTIKD